MPNDTPESVVRSLFVATNAHDLDAIVGHFTDDYVLEDPCHPDRSFHGADQVRRNWSQILGAVPNLVADLRRLTADSDTVWVETRMHGTRRDGVEHELRGVLVFDVAAARIAHGTFYLGQVERDGLDADTAVSSSTGGNRG